MEYLDYCLALWNEPYETGPLSAGGDFYNYFVLGLLPVSYNRTEGIYNTTYQPERYNFSSYDYTLKLFNDWVPKGYTTEAPLNYSQPFRTEDIVTLTDGACSSACAFLVEMFTQVGVKTVVASGRPTTCPTQAHIGGNRGAVIYSADQIDGRLVNF
ncbi:hypothetical protein E8E12_004968 [Didymella heteroderae]|uniref:Uncharacterized protein n=1 Tax=Didymella heteroderae TaxID=1769908 RepID=A0A9P5BZ82_9PLEO|nr:hypothetical protein E8E12_004968 [Didymella heteroderae]